MYFYVFITLSVNYMCIVSDLEEIRIMDEIVLYYTKRTCNCIKKTNKIVLGLSEKVSLIFFSGKALIHLDRSLAFLMF